MFKDFRCVDYGMNQGNFNMSFQEQSSSEANISSSTESMMNTNMSAMPAENYGCMMPGVVCPPVYECPIEKCVHRNIVHEVPHVCPINTRIINHHIYRHTYSPCYTCCEENEVCNIQEGNCCCFR